MTIARRLVRVSALAARAYDGGAPSAEEEVMRKSAARTQAEGRVYQIKVTLRGSGRRSGAGS